ncbi:MAG: hypothetical protein WC522_06925 [Candidatus Omnitrophota bacterium]
MQKLKIVVLAAAMIALAHNACAANITTQIDDEIPEATRHTIHAVNNRLFMSIMDNKPDVMINMFVAEGRAGGSIEADVNSSYKKLGELARGAVFTTLHEYFIDVKERGAVALPVPGDMTNKFLINVEGGNGPLFVSLLTSNGRSRDIMIAFIYIKLNDEWQLYGFNYGLYRVGGKTVVQWYDEAQKMYKNGWEVPAMLWIQFANAFIRPVPFVQYEREAEMLDFFKRSAAEAAKKYKFPMKAVWVKNTPMIYGFDTKLDKSDKLMPVIIYVTKYNLNSGLAIQSEADAITANIEKVTPGITRCSAEIGYEAFSASPLDDGKDRKYRAVMSKVR